MKASGKQAIIPTDPAFNTGKAFGHNSAANTDFKQMPERSNEKAARANNNLRGSAKRKTANNVPITTI